MTTIRVALAALAAAACACAPPATVAQPSASPPPRGSLFSAAPAQQWRLPPALREISGMASTADGRIFAHDDERAIIYELNVAQGGLAKAFSLGVPPLRGDFEGLAIDGEGAFYLITSEGEIRRFREGADGASVQSERFDTGLREVCEIEGLAYLAAETSLIIACKQNRARDQRDTVSLYAWRPGEAARLWRAMPAADIAGPAGLERFRPSSIEFDTRSGRMLLLSARDAVLAEFAPDGALIAARALGSGHIQPESLAITPDGSLLIADEGGDGQALLSRYGRNP